MAAMQQICIVDEDPYHIKVMGLMLQYRNAYRTFSFQNAERAWSHMLMLRPHAIICDLELKPVDGLALLRRVRTHNLTRAIPFLMVSMDPTEDAFRRAHEGGADALLPKPFTLAMFHDAVAEAAKRRKG
jgi:two-component system chemotaxis response regulator CheY